MVQIHTLSQKVVLRLLKFLNLVLIIGSFDLIYVFWFQTSVIFETEGLMKFLILNLLLWILYPLLGKAYDAFLISVIRVRDMVFSQVLAFLITDTVLYMVTCLLLSQFVNPLPFLLIICTQFFLACLWAWSCNAYYYHKYPPRRTVIIYDIRENFDDTIREYGMDKKFRIEKIITASKCLEDMDILDGYETVFMCGVHSKDRNMFLKYCINHRISVYIVPRIGDLLMRSAKPVHLFHLPMFRVEGYDPSPFYLLEKRLFDIIVSLAALIVLIPVFVGTALAIKLEDGGPVFYKQERLTRGSKKFMIHKFRSMRVDAEKDGVARLSSGDNDDRITRVGHFIRKVRIDELPQLIDILAGNLSIVGPRPEREAIALEYEKTLPEFRLRLQAKAGLTGYAQVYGKYNTTPYDKLCMDLVYISNPSFIEDIRICLATIKILFMPESTEGIAQGAVNAMESGKLSEMGNDAEIRK